MHVILVWEEVPEVTTVFLFSNVPPEKVGMFEKAHGTYLNSEIEDPIALKAITELNDYLENLENRDQYKVDEPLYVDRESLIVVCGIIV
jgi:hypothetical protein